MTTLRSIIPCICLFLPAILSTALADTGDECWSGLFSHAADLNGAIYDAVLYDGDVIVAGDFTFAGNVARWDGAAWRPMGAGLGCEEIAALCVHDGTLFAAGGSRLYPYLHYDAYTKQIYDPSYLYVWTGISWDPLAATNKGPGGGPAHRRLERTSRIRERASQRHVLRRTPRRTNPGHDEDHARAVIVTLRCRSSFPIRCLEPPP